MSALHYTVGIVGATGAVGKEIRSVLEARGVLNVEKLRIFGSERSAGTIIDSPSYGSIEVELFDVDKARQCDVVFLAVDGDFALKHAKAISDGDDGAVVIDNSVRFWERPRLCVSVFVLVVVDRRCCCCCNPTLVVCLGCTKPNLCHERDHISSIVCQCSYFECSVHVEYYTIPT